MCPSAGCLTGVPSRSHVTIPTRLLERPWLAALSDSSCTCTQPASRRIVMGRHAAAATDRPEAGAPSSSATISFARILAWDGLPNRLVSSRGSLRAEELPLAIIEVEDQFPREVTRASPCSNAAATPPGRGDTPDDQGRRAVVPTHASWARCSLRRGWSPRMSIPEAKVAVRLRGRPGPRMMRGTRQDGSKKLYPWARPVAQVGAVVGREDDERISRELGRPRRP